MASRSTTLQDPTGLAAPPEAGTPRFYYGYYLIGAALIAQFVSVGVQNYVLGPFLEPMTVDLDWSRSQFTLARTIGQIVIAACGFFVGTHVDRHGGRRLMVIGVGILAVALSSISFISELWQWLLLDGIVLSTGAALIGNLVVNVTLAKWFVEKRGMAVGWASMGVSLAGVALTPAITVVIDHWGWRAGWRVLAVGAVLLVVPASMFMRRDPEDHGLYPDGKTAEQLAAGGGAQAKADYDASFTRSEALRTSAFYSLVLAFGMFAVTIGVMLLQTVPFMTDAGYPRGEASLMVTLASIPALLSKPLWGFLMDKWSPAKLAALGAATTGGSMLLITLSVRQTFDPLVFLGFFMLGVGWGGLIPLQEVIWATYFGRRYLGAVRSAALPFTLVIGAGAPLLASLYFDRVGNYDGAFFTVAIVNLISAVMLMFVKRPVRPARPDLPTAGATA